MPEQEAYVERLERRDNLFRATINRLQDQAERCRHLATTCDREALGHGEQSGAIARRDLG